MIVKHIGGNLISRWTDFLTTDGEKPTRNRDAEFEMIDDSRPSIMQLWESGWRVLFANVEPLTADDFSKTVTIRGQPHTVIEAINRQLTHYAYHVGQIVFLAKHLRSSDWKTLSVPRNKSNDFNKFLQDRQEAGAAEIGRFEAAEVFSEREDTKKRPTE